MNFTSDNFEGDDYYAFLNVSRTATGEEINYAYRRLSRLYHPDKHIHSDRKKEAELLFSKTKRAYEVLIDPHLRAIYDSLGIAGLETQGWEIVQRTKTPQEIREEYERLAREKEERRLQQRTNPKSLVIMTVNATELFSVYDESGLFDLRDLIGMPHVEISGMSLSQSIDAPLTSKDTAILSALANQLDKHTVGYLTWKAGLNSGMNTMIIHDTESRHVVCSLFFGIPHTYCALSYTHKMPEREAKFKLVGKFGTFGAIIEYGAEKKVSQHSSVVATVAVGVPTGVHLKMRLAEKKKEAEAAVDLMRETVKRIVDLEENKKGLVIIQAWYGQLVGDKGSKDENFYEVIDVTIPLQCLVRDSVLILQESSKSQLPGFYDPCHGEDKELRIKYLFRAVLHEVTISDSHSLRIPKKSHRLEET